MKTQFFRSTVLFLTLVALVSISNAQTTETISKTDDFNTKKEFKQAINFCPVALAFGIYSMNYERLFTEKHGFLIRADYEDVPEDMFDISGVNVNGKGVIVNYRYHFLGGLRSPYVGAFGRYRAYNGEGTYEQKAFDFKLSEVTVGLNFGKRWVLKNGLNLNLQVGYGLFMDTKTVDDTREGVNELIKGFENNYDLYNGFLGELSIGYAF